MQNNCFVRGLGIGMAIGMAAGMLMTPHKKQQNMIGKALRAAGELADNISDALGR